MPPRLIPDGPTGHSGRVSHVTSDFLHSYFLDYLRKDSACASGEYGLFQFIFESLPQKKSVPGGCQMGNL